MSILVTGGLGFIGSHVVRELLQNGSRVIATRYGTEQPAAFLERFIGKNLTITQLDITDGDAVTKLAVGHRIDSVIHLAGTPIGVLAPHEEYRINMLGLLNIMEAARLAGARRVSIASSIAVYLGLEGPLREDLPVRLQPSHAIEAFKKAEELLGLYLARADGGRELIALRLASIYGPLYRSLRHWPAQLVHAAVQGASAPLAIAGLPPFHRDDHASDLCYISDAARAIRLVHQMPALNHAVYNIGGGQHVTLGRFSAAAAAIFPELKITMQDGTGPLNWPGSTLDLTRTHRDTGYAPEYSIERALEAYAGWLQAGNPF